MNATSAQTGADEWELSGLEAAPSECVAPPRVAASPVSFECQVTQIVRLRDRGGEDIDTWLVMGEAVGIHIDRAMIEDGVYVTTRARPILRGGGPADYFEALEAGRFQMVRPD